MLPKKGGKPAKSDKKDKVKVKDEQGEEDE